MPSTSSRPPLQSAPWVRPAPRNRPAHDAHRTSGISNGYPTAPAESWIPSSKPASPYRAEQSYRTRLRCGYAGCGDRGHPTGIAREPGSRVSKPPRQCSHGNRMRTPDNEVKGAAGDPPATRRALTRMGGWPRSSRWPSPAAVGISPIGNRFSIFSACCGVPAGRSSGPARSNRVFRPELQSPPSARNGFTKSSMTATDWWRGSGPTGCSFSHGPSRSKLAGDHPKDFDAPVHLIPCK
jgi:hypothetical protein